MTRLQYWQTPPPPISGSRKRKWRRKREEKLRKWIVWKLLSPPSTLYWDVSSSICLCSQSMSPSILILRRDGYVTYKARKRTIRKWYRWFCTVVALPWIVQQFHYRLLWKNFTRNILLFETSFLKCIVQSTLVREAVMAGMRNFSTFISTVQYDKNLKNSERQLRFLVLLVGLSSRTFTGRRSVLAALFMCACGFQLSKTKT